MRTVPEAQVEGRRVWLIPDGYLPPRGEAELVGHEAVCLLNTGRRPARVTLTVYFEDCEPLRGIAVTVGAERTLHLRLDDPEALGGKAIPPETPYALRVESTEPICVQHSRMDVSQPNLTLMTTMAYPLSDD